jgi:hypothetical protein
LEAWFEKNKGTFRSAEDFSSGEVPVLLNAAK